jgi:hypothetical protein
MSRQATIAGGGDSFRTVAQMKLRELPLSGGRSGWTGCAPEDGILIHRFPRSHGEAPALLGSVQIRARIGAKFSQGNASMSSPGFRGSPDSSLRVCRGFRSRIRHPDYRGGATARSGSAASNGSSSMAAFTAGRRRGCGWGWNSGSAGDSVGCNSSGDECI